jgi:arylsulfatase
MRCRKARYERQVKLGLVDPKTSPLSPMEYEKAAAKRWEVLPAEERKQEAMKMEVYAAMVDRVDQNIGRLLKRLEEQGNIDNTLILFLSDNGACAETPVDSGQHRSESADGQRGDLHELWPQLGVGEQHPLAQMEDRQFRGRGRHAVGGQLAGRRRRPQGGYYREPVHLIDLHAHAARHHRGEISRRVEANQNPADGWRESGAGVQGPDDRPLQTAFLPV